MPTGGYPGEPVDKDNAARPTPDTGPDVEGGGR